MLQRLLSKLSEFRKFLDENVDISLESTVVSRTRRDIWKYSLTNLINADATFSGFYNICSPEQVCTMYVHIVIMYTLYVIMCNICTNIVIMYTLYVIMCNICTHIVIMYTLYVIMCNICT